MTSEINTKGAGASQVEDRARQPKRAGGNSDAFGIESHGAAKAKRIAMTAGGTGKDSTFGLDFNQGGNCAAGKSEQHGTAKRDSLHGKTGDIPSNLEISERANGAGNSAKGPHEPRARGSERVGPERRFNS